MNNKQSTEKLVQHIDWILLLVNSEGIIDDALVETIRRSSWEVDKTAAALPDQVRKKLNDAFPEGLNDFFINAFEEEFFKRLKCTFEALREQFKCLFSVLADSPRGANGQSSDAVYHSLCTTEIPIMEGSVFLLYDALSHIISSDLLSVLSEIGFHIVRRCSVCGKFIFADDEKAAVTCNSCVQSCHEVGAP